MLVYRHWVIMAYSEKLSDIKALLKWKGLSHKKANIAFASAQTQVKKSHNSLKILRMTSEFELDLYFMMLYPSVYFEWDCYIPSKVIDRKPQFSQTLSKKGP